jgi:DNA-binding GntR family transcriptional regulator
VIVRSQRVHAVITDRLRTGIRRRAITPGTLLLEAPLAQLFGSSRSPVKQALEELREEGLISRSSGRGFVVKPAPTHVHGHPVTRQMLGLSADVTETLPPALWRTLYERIERELVQRSIFGQFRINEIELSRYYGIGRTVAHDVLIQIQSTGIIAKRERTSWFTIALDHKRINDLFDLRALLEPRLCSSAAGRINDDELRAMRARLVAGSRRYPRIESAEMDDLERDLHGRLLERGANKEFLEALRRTRCILISGKYILGNPMPYPRKSEFFFDEHERVLEAVRRGDGTRAGRELRAHLEASRVRVLERLSTFRERYKMKPLPFLSE